MAWLPRPGGKLLDAAARKAAELQRATYLHMLGLRMGDVLQPLDAEDKEAGATSATVKLIQERIGAEADALYQAHADQLPECHRAPVHLQMASIALASQRVLQDEAQRDDRTPFNALKVRTTVANALGVVAPDDGSVPYEVGAMYVPNKVSLFFTGATFIPSRRKPITVRMMENFEVDLGAGFSMEPLEPEPSRRMTKCFYASFLASEAASADAASDSALVLVPVFQAMHAATFCGIPGFDFEPDESGHGGVFRFEDPPV